jgi:hypothetical protein
MTFSINHKFVSAVQDVADATIIRPSNWNDTHNLTGTASSLLGFDSGGTGGSVTVGTGLSLSGGSLSAAAGGITIGTSPISAGTDTRVLFDKAGVIGEDAGLVYNYSSSILQLGSSASLAWSTDLFLVRDAANVLAQRNGTNTQTLRVYNTYSGGGTNYERGIFDWQGSSNILTIATEAGGSGTARHIEIKNAAATPQLVITNSGSDFTRCALNGGFSGNNTNVGINIYDSSTARWTLASYAAGGTNRSFSFYNEQLSKDGLAIYGDTNVVSFGITINSNSGGLLSGANGYLTIERLSGSGQTFFSFEGTSSSFPALKRSSAKLQVRLADDSDDAQMSVATINIKNYIVSGLPSASPAGQIAFVTDSTATAITGLGLAVVGTGGNKVLVYSDGTNWIVI